MKSGRAEDSGHVGDHTPSDRTTDVLHHEGGSSCSEEPRLLDAVADLFVFQ